MKALLIVDLQNDFLLGGALAVPQGDEIIPIVNTLIPGFEIIVATQDYHPADHVSFAASHLGKKIGDVIQVGGGEQILWPVHCVNGTKGAELSASLDQDKINRCFLKGTNKEIDSYSAFFDNQKHASTGVDTFLKLYHVTELYIAGLVTEYCVLYSSLDALQLGFQVSVVVDACRAINLQPHDEALSFAAITAAGGKLVTSKEVLFGVK